MAAHTPARSTPTRLVVLVSGSGTNLQALLDAIGADPSYGAEIVAVGADRESSAATTINGDQMNQAAPGAGAAYVL